MRIVIFGGGMQGRVIAKNLATRKEKPEVVLADVTQVSGLEDGVEFQKVDVLDLEQVRTVVKGADAAVLAVPSSIAHDALSNLIETGIAVVDVSFTPDPPLDLNDKAVKAGSCVVLDCGVAPGLSHILVGNAYAELGGLDRARILVGGIPQEPPAVFHHAIYFNASDLISEYTRPARAREKGKDIAPHPLDAPLETYDDKEVGKLDTFLSDGLRSLLTSYPDVPDMVERTMRWSGHMETMTTLGKLGMFDDEVVGATAFKLSSRYPAHKHPDLMLMIVEAQKGKKTKSWRLIDRCTNEQSAMSRTTGFTTAAVAMILAKKQFTTPGVHAPEKLGHEKGITEAILDDLAERGVVARELAAK